VGHHCAGVHTGICPAGSGESNGLSKQGMKCLFKDLLHRECIWLPLPAMVCLSKIREEDKISHGLCYFYDAKIPVSLAWASGIFNAIAPAHIPNAFKRMHNPSE
jgi:hypothetical protein